jgi:predicted  nucleic acid-binding Zn-ribbon protein
MLSDANQVIVESELADIVEERTRLQDAVPATKDKHSEAKKQFTDEKKRKSENGKPLGNL